MHGESSAKRPDLVGIG